MHADLAHDEYGPRLVSFIYMIDTLTENNGATCFGPSRPAKGCGPAGSLLVFDGAVLHGHGANTTALPRRSLQGAFVRRTESPAIDFAKRMSEETLDRLSPTARALLGLGSDT
jgi:ectoine hydroxylase-related dioxygenase (phytanoyl-CoA dioxygenase family)